MSPRDIVARFRLSDPPFAGRTGLGVRVAVIDSGIRVPHPHVPEVVRGAWVRVEPNEGAIRVDHGTFADTIGHGTAVAAAIHEKAAAAELWAVKVLDDRLTTSAPILAAAIDYASGSGARLINLSLGTGKAEHGALLAAATRRAATRNALVVAALEGDGKPSYPGSLAGVVGVLAEPECARDEIWIERRDERLVCWASPYPRPIPGVPEERNLSGTSFAVANVTGFLTRLLEDRRAASVDGLLGSVL